MLEVPEAPARSPLVRWLTLGLALLAVAAQLLVYDRNFVPMDEGHLALTASRLLDGDLLYRDIHTGIFPGIYAVTAGLFALFGEDVIVTRAAQVVVNAATVMLLFLIGVRIVPVRWALLPAVGFVALGWVAFPVLTMFNYSAVAGAFALGALLASLRWLERGDTVDGLAVGLLVGACLFTKQNYGGLVAVALSAVIALDWKHSALRDRSIVGCFAPIVLSGSAFLLLSIGWLAASDQLIPWLDRTLLSLVGSQLQDFSNPIPPILGAHPTGDAQFVYLYIPSSFFDYLVRGDRLLGLAIEPGFISAAIRLFYGLPIAALLVAPVWVAASGTRGPALSVVAFALVFFFGIFPSAVFSHLVYVLAPVLLVFAWLAHEAEQALAGRAPKAGRAVFPIGAVTVAAVFAACATIPGHIRDTYAAASELPHVSISVSADQATLHREAMQFVDECAAPGEPIFTLPIVPILYFASGHPNPVKWDLLIPGAIDQAAIIQTLERERVRCIVRQRDMNPEFPALEHLYPVLAGYIRSHYGSGRELKGGANLWYGLRRTAPFGGQVR